MTAFPGRGPGRLAALLLLAVVTVLGVGQAGLAAGNGDRTLSIYEPRHRPAEELLPLARTVLGDRGQAMVDAGSGSLLLVGPKEALAETVELLRLQDRRLRTVVLEYESLRSDSLEARGIRVDWSSGAGRVRVGNVRFPGRRSGVRISGYAVGTEREGGLTGLVRVLEGHTGRITTGTTVPITRRSRWDVDTTWVTAESGFEARPRVLGDGRIQVNLLPMESSVDVRGQVRYTAAATTVTVRPGETVAVGGVNRSSEIQRNGTRIYSASQRSSEERVLLLTVHLDGEGPTPASP